MTHKKWHLYKQMDEVWKEQLAMLTDGLQSPIISIINSVKQGDNSAILSCCLQLLENVNDIIEFCALKSHTLEVVTVPFSLAKVMDDVMAVKRFQIDGKRLQVRVRNELNGYQHLGDPTRVRQVMLALLSPLLCCSNEGARIDIALTVPDITVRVPALTHDASPVAQGLLRLLGGQMRSRGEMYLPLQRAPVMMTVPSALALYPRLQRCPVEGALRVLVTRSAGDIVVQMMQCCTHLVARCKVVDPPLLSKWLSKYDVVICAPDEYKNEYKGPVFIFTPQPALLQRLQEVALTSA